MATGHRLNTSIVLAAVHGLSGLFPVVSVVEPSLFRPLPPLSPSISRTTGILASVDVKQNGQVLCSCVCVELSVIQPEEAAVSLDPRHITSVGWSSSLVAIISARGKLSR